MSSVTPNGQIRFLTNIPIDSNYENSLDFQTELEQRTYFLSQTPVHSQIGATRVRDGVISVNKLSDELLSANYLMFQNLNFSTKWFYAFITDVEYINNNMSYVYYQIDDIQTWLFDVELKECFVEREHTSTDGMFEHLVDEGINVSEYVRNTQGGHDYDFSRMTALLFSTSIVQDPTTGSVHNVYAKAYNGVFNGCSPTQFDIMKQDGTWDSDEIARLNTYIDAIASAQQTDAIIGLVLYPYRLVTEFSESANEPDTLEISNFTSNSPIDGYTPKNKKLYNSPFCMLKIGTSDGQQEMLQPEFINDGCCVLIYANASMTPSVQFIVQNYKNKNHVWDKQIMYDGLPQCCIALDGYKAWCASGGLDRLIINTTSSVAGDIVSGVASYQSQNAVGVANAVIDAGNTIANAMVTLDVAKTLPPNIKGSTKPYVNQIYKMLHAYSERITIKADVVKSLDDYFTMFGYKVNKIKQPSRRNRPHYTYLKTKSCHVNGGAPADAIQRIETIYDNGVRFWVNPSEVGNYEVNNAPA